MKIYQWTCPRCYKTFQNKAKEQVLKEKESHLSHCSKPHTYTASAPKPEHVEPIDTIEIIH